MNMNMVTTVMAFSVSAFFVLFIFTRLLCTRLHLRTAAAAPGDHVSGDAFVVSAYNVERGISGLEPSEKRSFPTVKVGDGGTQRPPAQEAAQCTVCLEEYAAKDVVRVLPACGHAFHTACIDAWLRQHPTCPRLPHLRQDRPPRRRRKGLGPRALVVPHPNGRGPTPSDRCGGWWSAGDDLRKPASAAGGDHSGCCGGDTARPSASSSASEHC